MMKASLFSLIYTSIFSSIDHCISFMPPYRKLQTFKKRRRLGLFKSFALMCGSIAVFTVNAEIYKWTDDKGNVHYGDCPPDSCASQEIKIVSPPSDQTIRETQDKIKRIQMYQKKLSEDRAKDEKQISKPVVSTVIDLECFTSLGDSWGGKIKDIREKAVRRSITNAELLKLRNYFSALKGSWKGSMEDTDCVQPDATPPQKTYQYDTHLDARWNTEQLFEIKAELEGDERDASLKSQFFWFLLSSNGLRFRRGMSEIVPDLDKKKYDVEILTVRNDSLTFYFQRGGALMRVNVFVIQQKDRGFTISEFYFVQGALAGKRFWVME
jgi:hypothetical protein